MRRKRNFKNSYSKDAPGILYERVWNNMRDGDPDPVKNEWAQKQARRRQSEYGLSDFSGDVPMFIRLIMEDMAYEAVDESFKHHEKRNKI